MLALSFGVRLERLDRRLGEERQERQLDALARLEVGLGPLRAAGRSVVRSTSTTVVSWAETCSDSTMRAAMTLRSRDIFSVVPRSGDGRRAVAAWPRRRRGRCRSACWRGLLPWPPRRPRARPACGCGRRRRCRCSVDRSTPCSAASLRTSGVTYARRRRRSPSAAGAAAWCRGGGLLLGLGAACWARRRLLRRRLLLGRRRLLGRRLLRCGRRAAAAAAAAARPAAAARLLLLLPGLLLLLPAPGCPAAAAAALLLAAARAAADDGELGADRDGLVLADDDLAAARRRRGTGSRCRPCRWRPRAAARRRRPGRRPA